MNKRLIFLINILLLILFPLLVFAGGGGDDSTVKRGQIDMECVYKGSFDTNETYYYHLRFTILGTIPHIGGATPNFQIKIYAKNNKSDQTDLFFRDQYNEKSFSHALEDYVINIDKEYGIKFHLESLLQNVYEANVDNDEDLKNAETSGAFCPKTLYMVEDKIEKTYKSMLCNGHNSVWNEDTCNNALNYVKSNIRDFASEEEGENVRIITMNYFMNSSFSNVGQNSYSDPDIEEEYTEIVDQIKDECDEESENYNAENCMVLNEIKDNVVDRADDMDIKESELYLKLPDISLTPDALDCVGILGRPDDNISKPPAFYLQTAFTVMKYVAIVILIVFTIMDYASAVAAQDDDAIKKATSKLVTRLIICVILFVLPTIIEFLFKILDIYGDVEHCKIN